MDPLSAWRASPRLTLVSFAGVGSCALDKVLEELGTCALIEHDTAGDPMHGIKWTLRTTQKIAAELAAGGIEVCPTTVARLLRQLGFRLRVNHKELTRRVDPHRDAQFASKRTFGPRRKDLQGVVSRVRPLSERR